MSTANGPKTVVAVAALLAAETILHPADGKPHYEVHAGQGPLWTGPTVAYVTSNTTVSTYIAPSPY
jgi:hypothetical protein